MDMRGVALNTMPRKKISGAVKAPAAMTIKNLKGDI